MLWAKIPLRRLVGYRGYRVGVGSIHSRIILSYIIHGIVFGTAFGLVFNYFITIIRLRLGLHTISRIILRIDFGIFHGSVFDGFDITLNMGKTIHSSIAFTTLPPRAPATLKPRAAHPNPQAFSLPSQCLDCHRECFRPMIQQKEVPQVLPKVRFLAHLLQRMAFQLSPRFFNSTNCKGSQRRAIVQDGAKGSIGTILRPVQVESTEVGACAGETRDGGVGDLGG